jgi:hypothetical protein
LYDFIRAKATEGKLGEVQTVMEKEFLDTLM